ncbi:exosortase/archaeosortase family protein [Psychromicrobium silvestre]|uniref:Exosortase/archaeosortase family protein n=1 Tax=Psychromicrobium silvestre TaxID=1645614 RepID=A0A7Y9LUU1_9MICC|nr:exosortase/archaeosortase family protein [Psychromicrobium silvestre]NYE95984.1 exosortase/archaeosortase family protein [Psychromicrobium silvestre]
MSTLPLPGQGTVVTVSRLQRVLRWIVALTMLAFATVLLSQNVAVRELETKLLAFWFSPLLIGGVKPNDTHFLVTIPPGQLIAFNITFECTVLLLILPLTALSALLLAFTKTSWTRVASGLLVSSAVVLVINQLRLALIAFTTQTWGLDFGYQIGHRFIGSLIALFGFALGFLIVLRIAFKTNKFQQRKAAASTPRKAHRR